MRDVALFLLLASFLIGGCGVKPLKKGVPFDLDQVFPGVFAAELEGPKEKGLRLVKARDYAGAIEAFKNYVLEQPEDFFGFNAIAVCYKNLGDNAKAMQNFERALEFAHSPEERAKVLANIGNLYSASGKYQVALGYFKEAYNEFPENPMYLILIARTFIYLDEPQRAQKVVKTIEEAMADLPRYEREEDKGLGYYLLAQVYAALNEEEKVFETLRKAMKANPSRFIARIEADSSDETNLFYTLKDDSRLKRLIRAFAG
ncbi:MAG: tetratricopeptide repeat protein [Desulfomonilaceae bacterium]